MPLPLDIAEAMAGMAAGLARVEDVLAQITAALTAHGLTTTAEAHLYW